MIDVRDLRIGSHVAHKRYPDRVCRVECIMPTSVYLSYDDNGVRIKMFNVSISDLEPLKITEERLEALSEVTGMFKELFRNNVEWHTLETFTWIEYGEEVIAE